MAVNLTNGLVDKIDFSGIVVTRKEGNLKRQLHINSHYLFLNKKSRIDFKAVFIFRKFLKENKITHIQAHSSSWFFAVLTFFVIPSVKIIWHDHFGNRANYNNGGILLRLFSVFFSSVIVVNSELKEWSKKKLFVSKIYFIPNFSNLTLEKNKTTHLKGVEGKRIICVANLKDPKNHLFLIQSFFKSKLFLQEWSLHLIGNDFKDTYAQECKEYVQKNNISNHVYFYGSCDDISNIMQQANVGVLASTYEGFPVTLLEYGYHKLLVLSTNVGYCSNLIKNDKGYLFSPFNQNELVSCLQQLVTSSEKNEKLAVNFNSFVIQEFSSKTIIEQFLTVYRT